MTPRPRIRLRRDWSPRAPGQRGVPGCPNPASDPHSAQAARPPRPFSARSKPCSDRDKAPEFEHSRREPFASPRSLDPSSGCGGTGAPAGGVPSNPRDRRRALLATPGMNWRGMETRTVSNSPSRFSDRRDRFARVANHSTRDSRRPWGCVPGALRPAPSDRAESADNNERALLAHRCTFQGSGIRRRG